MVREAVLLFPQPQVGDRLQEHYFRDVFRLRRVAVLPEQAFVVLDLPQRRRGLAVAQQCAGVGELQRDQVGDRLRLRNLAAKQRHRPVGKKRNRQRVHLGPEPGQSFDHPFGTVRLWFGGNRHRTKLWRLGKAAVPHGAGRGFFRGGGHGRSDQAQRQDRDAPPIPAHAGD